MLEVELHKWIAVGIISLIILLLVWDKLKASIVFSFGVLMMVFTGIIDVGDYFLSFSNQSVITIFLLIFITSVVKENFNLLGMLDYFFSSAKSTNSFLLKMGFSVAGLSSVMNNTPIVALMTPYVYQWGKRNDVSPSKLLMPLSFAAILGGVTTVIGTSTNLVLNGFLRSNNEQLLGTLDFIIPGVIVTFLGIVYFIVFAKKLLPSNVDVSTLVNKNIREYLFETKVKAGKISGKTVSEAGLRNLKGAFIAQIYRGGEVLKPVGPNMILQNDDRLYFAGDSKTVLGLVESDMGLDWAKSDKFYLGSKIKLVEVVIPRNSKLVGLTLRECSFRETFDAAVIAIHRNGEKLEEKLGEIKFEVGDLLLLTSGEGFEKQLKESKDLYSVSIVKDWKEKKTWEKTTFLVGSGLSLLLSLFGMFSFVASLLFILALAIGLKLSSINKFKKQLNLDLLLILIGAITLGKGLIESGASELIGASYLSFFSAFGVEVLLVSLFVLTLILTSFVTNVAALSIVFPLAFQIVHDYGVDGTAFYLAIAFAASAAFITPVSYQTNLIVYGPGGYKFKDFVQFGLPLTLLYSIVVLVYLIFIQL